MAHTLRWSRIGVWLIPLTYSAAGLTLGVSSHWLAHNLLPGFVSTISVASAIGFYSAIASGMIALTGIVFSLLFVLVQFSATVYSPRLVFWVSRDPVTSHTLGAFMATFLYSLTALVWVDRAGSSAVPMVAVIFATVLLLASMCMFVSLIQRVGVLQVSRMMIFTADQARRVIDRLYPELEVPRASWAGRRAAPPALTLLHSGRPMVVQSVDTRALAALASEASCVIELGVAPGDTLLEGATLARVHGGVHGVNAERVKAAIGLGYQRDFREDPLYSIRLLVDIAIRALSPAINDPTTAVQALDQIGDLLLRLARRRFDSGLFRDVAGKVRVVVPVVCWDEVVRLALDEVRACGATSVQVMRRMNALVAELLAMVPEERRPALVEWRERLHSTVQHAFSEAPDRIEALVGDRLGLGGVRSYSLE